MATFTNRATLSYNNGVVNSNTVTGQIVEVLSASKTALTDSYGSGDTVTYVINLINSGNTAYTGLTVTDDLGAYDFGTSSVVPLSYINGTLRYFINGELQTVPSVGAVSPLTVTGINVPANGNASIVYSALTNEFAPLANNSQIVNTATVTGGGLSAPVTATETIRRGNEPVLSISKSLNPLSVPVNGTLTYTFVIRNTGFTEAADEDNIVIRDVFDPILDITSVTLNGTALTPATGYTYDRTTGTFATVAGAVTVPAATFEQNASSGAYSITPGAAILTITGTV